MIEYIVKDKIIIYMDYTPFNNEFFKKDFKKIKLIPS